MKSVSALTKSPEFSLPFLSDWFVKWGNRRNFIFVLFILFGIYFVEKWISIWNFFWTSSSLSFFFCIKFFILWSIASFSRSHHSFIPWKLQKSITALLRWDIIFHYSNELTPLLSRTSSVIHFHHKNQTMCYSY